MSFGGYEGRFSRDPLPVFSAGGLCGQFWHEHGCPFFDIVNPAFSLPTTASPTLQSALKQGFGETVVACDMPEPRKFPSLVSCRKRFLQTHEEVNLAPHPVVGLVLHLGDAVKLPHALGFNNLDPFSESANRVLVSQP